MQAMIFAAGLGSRLLEETSGKPKALVDIGGKPLLQHAIDKLKSIGISNLVINVHHHANLVKEYIGSNDFGLPVRISDESEKLLETGGGLKKATHFFTRDKSILLYNVDVLCSIDLNQLIKDHQESGALATLVVRKRSTQRYFRFTADKRLSGWINKSTGEKRISIPGEFEKSLEMAFSGIHVVRPEIFDLMPDEERFSITDFYIEIAGKHKIMGYYDSSDLWMDVGKPDQLAKARKNFS